MIAAHLVTRLAQAGIDAELLADVAQELFAAEAERKALAERRHSERERKARSRDRTGQGGTSRERRGPPKENIKPQSSEANASAAEPLRTDPVKEVFDLGVSILTANGTDEKQARSLLGKWRKSRGEAEVLTALIDCRAKSISEPLEWLTKRLQKSKWVSPSGYEYRGSDEQVLREAEKRNDMTTYWAIKGQLNKKQAA